MFWRHALRLLDLGQQLLPRVDTGESYVNVASFFFVTKRQRNSPPAWKRTEHVLETVDGRHGSAGKRQQLVAIPQTTAIGIRGVQDVGHDHSSAIVRRDGGSQRGVIHDPTAVQAAEEFLDLVDRDRVAHTDVDSSSLFKGAASVDSDQAALGVEEWPSGVARIDGRVGLNAVGVFQECAGGRLIAMNARHDAIRKDGWKSVASKNGLPTAKHQSPARTRSLSPSSAAGKSSRPKQLDQCHVARRIDAHDHGVVESSVGHAALHVRAGRFDDVEVRKRKTIGRNDHAGTAAISARFEYGDGRFHRPSNGFDPGLFRLEHRCRWLLGRPTGHTRKQTDERVATSSGRSTDDTCWFI